MLYLVKIGRTTRHGGFQELFSMPIQSDSYFSEIENYYKCKYRGFEVSIKQFEETIIEKLDTKDREKNFITGIYVKYTDEEQRIADEYGEKNRETFYLLEKLHQMIRKRYNKYHWVNVNEYEGRIIELETDSNSTIITKLPIYGRAFIQHIGEGKEI